MDKGYLYIVGGGQKYVDEAIQSARSLKRVHSDAHLTLITDKESSNSVFDQVIVRADGDFSTWRGGLAYRVEHIYKDSPYKKTLFVDSDTYFYESCEPIFELLEHFDVCMASAPVGQDTVSVNGKVLSAYTLYNCGVIAFRKNDENEFLFSEWQRNYQRKLENWKEGVTKGNDQSCFMEALLFAKSRVYVLTNLWNARTPKAISLRGTVKIVHGRHDDFEALREKINVTHKERFWDPYQEKCIIPGEGGKLKSKIKNLLHRKRKTK
jgi:hypothetical protein